MNDIEIKQFILKTGIFIIMTMFVIMIDYVSKYKAVKKFKNEHAVIVKGILKYKIVKNEGAAFGLLKKKRKLLFVLNIFLLILLIFISGFLCAADKGFFGIAASSFMLGGGLGNFIDRYKKGYVTDWLSLKFKKLPYFNFADLFILTGSVIMVSIIIFL